MADEEEEERLALSATQTAQAEWLVTLCVGEEPRCVRALADVTSDRGRRFPVVFTFSHTKLVSCISTRVERTHDEILMA